MKIAVTGHRGRLGSELLKRGCIPINADIIIPEELQTEIERTNPDTIIHCASITDVDKCENEYAEKARKVNIMGTHILRTAFHKRIVYMSTDYVFDGVNGAYKENSPTNPINHYGMTKYMGEQIIKEHKYPEDIIVRTTILYGGHKPDFVTKVLDHYKEEKSFEVSNSIYGSPTHVFHLADALMELCYKDWTPTIINIAGSNVISRYEFALMIGNVFGYNTRYCIPTKKVAGQAQRPKKAGLKVDLAKKIGLPIYSVIEGLELMRRTENGNR